MILYQNNLVTLNYEPTTDILSAVWPNVEPYNLMEVKDTLRILAESIRNYDVKKLFIDGSKTSISPDLDQEEYKRIVMEFAQALATTRLQKSARLVTSDEAREVRSQELSAEVKEKVQLNIQNQNFTTEEEAMSWLLA